MFQIDVMSRTPVYEQLVEQVERFILKGILKSGDKMPSVRAMSMELSVNPNTIQKAVSELDRKGLIYSVPGKGCFISEQSMKALSIQKRSELDGVREQLRELALAGITKEEMIKCIEDIYQEEGNGHD